jgi:GR25 family glycosyltransferase involved in LPS biosynthesis
MKFKVITILDNPQSVEVAERCIASGAKFGYEIGKFKAITPSDKPLDMLRSLGISEAGFHEKYSFLERAVSAFLSHHALWEECAKENEPYVIFEHDAVVIDLLPIKHIQRCPLLNLGKPSYGKFNIPPFLGANQLTSKRYMPGAHAYSILPSAAKYIIEAARHKAGPTDVFLHMDRFPWLEEFYPWPVEARDSFTTIQREAGCLAKHNYNPGYKLL